MNSIDVRIVKLEPMHVAAFHGFGEGPEMLAWDKLVTWAEPKGLLDYSDEHIIFGFNNPSPSPSSPNYGYEYWMKVDPSVQSEGEMKVKEFAGGLYAVTRCEVVGDAYDTIPETWQKLLAWRENSPYKGGNHQWLERHIKVQQKGENFILDLYLPITE